MKQIIKYIILLFLIIPSLSGYSQFTLDSIVTTDVSACYGDATGTITIYVSGGTGDFHYSIDGGYNYVSSPNRHYTFTGLPLNSLGYEVYVKDFYNVIVSDAAYIDQPNEIHITNEDQTDVTQCYGDSDGTISITAEGGTGILYYSIDNGTTYFNNSGNFTGLLAGSYNIKVRDDSLCVKDGIELEINQPLELNITSEVATDVLGCYGADNGAVDIVVTGGTSPIYYSIDNGVSFQASTHFAPLSPGNYFPVVKDKNDCISTNGTTLTVSGPDQVIITSESHTNVTECYNDHNGTITVIATGGIGHLQYSIDGGANFVVDVDDNGVTFSNLFAGSYEIVVHDTYGCTAYGSTITITQPNEMLIDSVRHSDISTCFGDATGQITIYAHGGDAPLEYSIDGGTNWQFSNIFNSILAGTYTTKIRDVHHSCETSGPSVFVEQPIQLSIYNVNTTDVTTCFNGNDGTIHIVTNGGGTSPYTFSIDNGATFVASFDFTGLSAGIYDVIVEDSHLCRDTFTNNIVEIHEPPELIITDINTTDPLCFGGTDGLIEVTVTGGTGNIDYSTNGGLSYFSGNVIGGLSAGINYNIWARDSHGCLATTPGNPYILGQPDELILDSIVKHDVIGCIGNTTGSIIIYAHGGTPIIQYSINGDNSSEYQISNTFLNLGQSFNNIMIKDGNECKISGGDIEITEPEPVQISYESFVNVVGCNGDATGEIHIDAIGGTPPYDYSIDNGTTWNSTNNGDFTGLIAGTYYIKVKDENDCEATGSTINLSEPPILIAGIYSQTNLNCFADNSGIINLTANGGEFPYKFSINNGATYQTGAFFSGLPAGTYHTYVKDAYNCIQPGPDVTLTQPDTLSIDSVHYENVSGCFGNNNGTITVFASGGTPSYLGYSFSNNLGTNWYNNNGFFTNLSPGDYFIKIQDSLFCDAIFYDSNMDIDTITITEPTQIVIDSINKTDILCYQDDNGTINVFASGGTGTIEYSIDNGTSYPNTTGVFGSLVAASYTVKARDANNCRTSSINTYIYEPDSLYIDTVLIEHEVCHNANDAVITIISNGGTRPYQFSIDGINYLYERRIENLAPGLYTPTIRDTNLCVASYHIIEIDSAYNPSLFTTDITEGCSPLAVQFNRLNDGTTYLWEFGDGETSSQNEPLHIFNNTSGISTDYTITAYSISPENCRDTAEMSITVYPQPLLFFTLNPSVTYYPETTIQINDISLGYSNYNWDFGDGQTSTDVNPISHTYGTCGDYTVSLTAENSYSCTDTIYRNVLIRTDLPVANFEIDTSQHCTPYSFNFNNLSYSYDTFEWILEDGSILHDNEFSRYYDTPGIYEIKLKTFGYCNTLDSMSKTIEVFQSPVVDFTYSPDTVLLPSQPIHCYNNSSEDSEFFFWEFGDGGTSSIENPQHFYTEEGRYPIKLTVISVNKCVDSLTLLTDVIVLPGGKISFPNAFTPNGDGDNDTFKPAIYKSVESFELEIFNRWGELIFKTTDIDEGWTGLFDGEMSIQDVYIWRATGKYLNKTPFEMAGSVTLIR